jgi:hypothetical protein
MPSHRKVAKREYLVTIMFCLQTLHISHFVQHWHEASMCLESKMAGKASMFSYAASDFNHVRTFYLYGGHHS